MVRILIIGRQGRKLTFMEGFLCVRHTSNLISFNEVSEIRVGGISTATKWESWSSD